MPDTTLFRSFSLLEDEDRFLSDFQNLRFIRAYRTSYIFRQKHPIGIHIQLHKFKLGWPVRNYLTPFIFPYTATAS